MFETKQSDVFYNEQTKQMFVCTVSSISGYKCKGSSERIYSAVPIIYKIDKDTNYKSRVYPRNLDTFLSDGSTDSQNSELFDLTPRCTPNNLESQTHFTSITKPLLNYNKTKDRYSVTFLGKYSDLDNGFGIYNYIFQYIDTSFYLLDAKNYVPDKPSVFHFLNGYISSDLITGGNTIRNYGDNWYADTFRTPNYLISPTYLHHNNSLGFNLMQIDYDQFVDHVTTGDLTGDEHYPLMYSGGFITYNPKYTTFDPTHDIRVDFTARSFNVDPMTAFGSVQDDEPMPTRWIEKYKLDDPTDAGSGFCVYFHNDVQEDDATIVPNGVGSTLGYSSATANVNEVAGSTQIVDGLFIERGNIGTGLLGEPANSFLGVGFDIEGDFCTTSEGKPGWVDGTESWTTSPCSVGIRGNRSHDTKVLTCIPMTTVAASAVPMHTNTVSYPQGLAASDVPFVDYRIDLSEKGSRLTVYNKLTSDTDYNTILDLNLNSTPSDGNPIGGCIGYDPWGNIGEPLVITPTLAPLNIGLTFTTANSCSYFELLSFEATGQKIGDPNKKQKKQSSNKAIEYLEESSKNLRKKLVTIDSDNPVDMQMLIPLESMLDRISLCDMPRKLTSIDVEIKWTGIPPHRIPGRLPTPHFQPNMCFEYYRITKGLNADISNVVEIPIQQGDFNYDALLGDDPYGCPTASGLSMQLSNHYVHNVWNPALAAQLEAVTNAAGCGELRWSDSNELYGAITGTTITLTTPENENPEVQSFITTHLVNPEGTGWNYRSVPCPSETPVIDGPDELDPNDWTPGCLVSPMVGFAHFGGAGHFADKEIWYIPFEIKGRTFYLFNQAQFLHWDPSKVVQAQDGKFYFVDDAENAMMDFNPLNVDEKYLRNELGTVIVDGVERRGYPVTASYENPSPSAAQRTLQIERYDQQRDEKSGIFDPVMFLEGTNYWENSIFGHLDPVTVTSATLVDTWYESLKWRHFGSMRSYFHGEDFLLTKEIGEMFINSDIFKNNQDQQYWEIKKYKGSILGNTEVNSGGRDGVHLKVEDGIVLRENTGIGGPDYYEIEFEPISNTGVFGFWRCQTWTLENKTGFGPGHPFDGVPRFYDPGE